MEPPAGPPPIMATSKSGFVRTNVLAPLKDFSRWGVAKSRSFRGQNSDRFGYHTMNRAAETCQENFDSSGPRLGSETLVTYPLISDTSPKNRTVNCLSIADIFIPARLEVKRKFHEAS
jgi:hypothetical protein